MRKDRRPEDAVTKKRLVILATVILVCPCKPHLARYLRRGADHGTHPGYWSLSCAAPPGLGPGSFGSPNQPGAGLRWQDPRRVDQVPGRQELARAVEGCDCRGQDRPRRGRGGPGSAAPVERR